MVRYGYKKNTLLASLKLNVESISWIWTFNEILSGIVELPVFYLIYPMTADSVAHCHASFYALIVLILHMVHVAGTTHLQAFPCRVSARVSICLMTIMEPAPKLHPVMCLLSMAQFWFVCRHGIRNTSSYLVIKAQSSSVIKWTPQHDMWSEQP